MKRTCIAIALALAGMLLAAGTLQAQEACSDPAQFRNFTTLYSQATRLAEIQKRLDNPAGYPELLKNGRYEVCIQMVPHLVPVFAADAAIIVKPANLDIVVVGLNLMRNNTLEKPLVIVRNTGTKNVEVRNLTLALVKNGMVIDGTGPVAITASTVEGDITKSGTCVDVKAPNAIISGVTVSSCNIGVLVWANGVQIKDKSVIKQNKVGVEFEEGIKGSVVTEALVYLNDDGDDSNLQWGDGIRLLNDDDPYAFELAEHKPLRPVYYDVEGVDAVPVDDDPTITTPYVFKGRNANILVDDLKEYFKTSTNTVEVRFFNSQDGECGEESFGQSCAYTALGAPLAVTISAANFDEGKPVTVAIPDEFADKALAVLYSDSEMGTLGFSRPFKVSPGGVVAFVATPYDIPTTSGESADDAGSDEGNTAGDSMGGNTMSEGGGDGLIEAAGPGAKCTLNPRARLGAASVVVDLLWLLLILGMLGGSRLLPLPARISQRLRRRK